MLPQDFIYLTFIPQTILFWLKLIFGSISVLLIASMIFFIRRTGWFATRYGQDFKEFLSFKPFESRKYEKMWKKIINRLQQDSESEHKLAVIEADNLLMHILDRLGYKGETSSERLRLVPSDILPNLNKIMETHKIRNHIIYDVDYRIDKKVVQEMIGVYEETLQGLGVFG